MLERAETLNLPIKYVCYEANIPYLLFRNRYINSPDLAKEKRKVPAEKLLYMLRILGCELRIQLVIKKDFNPDAVRHYLKAKHSRHGKKQQKKRESGTSAETERDNSEDGFGQ
jgi:hypothetical protein